MKKIVTILCVVTLVMTSGCASKETEYRSDITVYTSGDLLMYVKEGTVSSTGISVIVYNHTGKTFFSGADNNYHLEYFLNGKWYYVKPIVDGWAVVSIAKGYGTGTYKITVNWEEYYGELSPGRYRFVKKFTTEYNKEDIWLAAEFSIE